ncbi:hypothetical protein ZIOFF_027303 [Zingiber officinale]|uniref:Exocyst complex component Sec3 PIP2-binding N-terminal domain-containing protein n=1 Tax=Zingiber officinale TaxID=94328 RepID=A0A8J5H590_ZINOF|nr:hypothetical protein ZIOFF_027303 [Zingiber officinale]
MARSSADDFELRRACEVAIDAAINKQKVVLSIRVAKSRGVWGKTSKLGRQMAKPRVLALTTKAKGPKIKAFLRVLKDSGGGGVLEGFDNLRSQSVAPPQWTMRNKGDRNRILLCILNMSKEILGRLPKVVGIDIVEMALWAKENNTAVSSQVITHGGQDASGLIQGHSQVTVERDLVSQAEEEDMEALLGTYVMGIGEAEAFSERLKRELLALEAANVHALVECESIIEEVLQGLEGASTCVEDMDEWLGIFNVKLRHMREDIESIESRNNKLELQSVSNKALIEELDRLLERFQIPQEYEECLTGDYFDEANVHKNVEVCEWLTGALHNLEASNLDPCYARMRGIKEKRAELVLLKCTFVCRASEFLRNYFPSLVDQMMNDKSLFSQRGQLKRPDHADLRYKCRTYARLLMHIKTLDKNFLAPLRKAFCHSLNVLLRREAREFANELRGATKVANTKPILWLEGPISACQGANADSSSVSEAYSKMLTVFIPLLVDESAFFAHFMCFDVAVLASSDGTAVSSTQPMMVPQGNYINSFLALFFCNDAAELAILNECLKELLAGLEEDFYSIVDWAYKIDPLCCITMHGITERYLSADKADTSGFVHLLLDELEIRISMLFSRFVDDACYSVEKYERGRQTGVLPCIQRFAILASRMEQYTQGQSRDLVDQAYTKIVSIMFVALERAAQVDSKYSDIVLLENYAAFQNSLYDLANVVPTLAKFYHQASESYEQACLRHVSMVIYIHFEKLFQFARRVEELMHTIPPEEIPFQIGMSKADLRKMLKSSLSGLDKIINAMYRKLQKNTTAQELLPSLWDKCKKEFLEKYGSFVQLVAKIYVNEPVPSVAEMRDALASM